MTLEKLIKKGKAFAVGLALAASLAGCNWDLLGSKGSSDSSPSPPAPDTSIGMDFGNGYDGNVNYLLTGINASTINARFNGGAWNNYPNGIAVSMPIILGTNTAEAAVPNDSTPATRSFYSPINGIEENNIVSPVIETLLQNAGYFPGIDNQFSYPQKTYIKNGTIIVGSTPIVVDYKIVCPNNKLIGEIEYVNHSPDVLATKLNERQTLISSAQLNPSYMSYLPADEVGTRVTNYINTVMNAVTCP